MRRAYAKSSKGGKKAKQDILLLALRWVVGFAGTLFLSWALIFPYPPYSGRIGAGLAGQLFLCFGRGAYLLPILLLHGLLQYVHSANGWLLRALASAFSFAASCTLMAVVAGLVRADSRWAGLWVLPWPACDAGIGAAGALILSTALLAFGLQVVFGIHGQDSRPTS